MAPKLEVAVRRVNGAVAIDLAGRIVHENKELLKSELEKLARPVFLIINMERVEYVDSSGVGTLIAAYTDIIAGGGQFAFVKPTARITEILRRMKLDTVFRAFDSEREALEKLNPV